MAKKIKNVYYSQSAYEYAVSTGQGFHISSGTLLKDELDYVMYIKNNSGDVIVIYNMTVSCSLADGTDPGKLPPSITISKDPDAVSFTSIPIIGNFECNSRYQIPATILHGTAPHFNSGTLIQHHMVLPDKHYQLDTPCLIGKDDSIAIVFNSGAYGCMGYSIKINCYVKSPSPG